MTITSHPGYVETVEMDRSRCQQVIAQTKGLRLKILYLFAVGLQPQEVAECIGREKKTVDYHKTKLLDLCRIAWNIPCEYITYDFLYEKFAWLADGSNEEAAARDRLCCEQVISQAKSGSLKILRPFAAGLHPQEVANRLGIAEKTVDFYKTKLLDLCHIAWGIPYSKRLDYNFLRRKFSRYFGDDM